MQNIKQIETKNKSKMQVVDAHALDEKVPRSLIMKFGNNFYILKAGLEWKASKLFGFGKYSIDIEIVDRKPDDVLVKATLTATTGQKFVNFGEASKANVTNVKMHPHLLHLAITRAECRVLRMATASGYASYDEVAYTDALEEEKPKVIKQTSPAIPNGNLLADDAQLATIKILGGEDKKYTRQEAAEAIRQLSEKKGGVKK